MPKSLDFLDTNGGHILVCLTLLVLGAAFTMLKLPKGDDIIVFSLGVLARSMLGGKSADLPDPASTQTISKITKEVETKTDPEQMPPSPK